MSRFFNFSTLRSAVNAWWSPATSVSSNTLASPFLVVKDIDSVHEFFAARTAAIGSIPDSTRTLNGQCFICRSNVDFQVDPPPDGEPLNWRETLVCPRCHLINRWRGCLHLFETLCEPATEDSIYLTETLSPVYQHLTRRFPRLQASEFLPPAEPGSIVQTHGMNVRNEDVTRLSFKDNSFSSVLCFDVLEHVPDYRSALREFFRVSSPGGRLLLSVPFSFSEETVVRAELDPAGNIKHLVEPCYHGDPLSEQGVLSYYDFGMALLGEMARAGFQDSCLVCYCSKSWGYLHQNVAFVGRKP